MAEAIYRKYRPMTFGDVTGQEHVKKVIQNQITQNLLAHAYLFSGPRGVGKTTIARLLAKTVNCENRKDGEGEPCNTCANCEEMNSGHSLDIVEIDAASNTGVDNVRENIVDAIRFAPNKSKHKVFIIDEVHMLSTAAFNALLKTLEEPPAYAIFILATTELHKIPATILSRCMRFNFTRIPPELMIQRLETVSTAEGCKVELEVLQRINRLSEGCLRDAESFLNQLISLGQKDITTDIADTVLPSSYIGTIDAFMEILAAKNSAGVIQRLNQFVDEGGSIKHLLEEWVEYLRAVLFVLCGAEIGVQFAGFNEALKKDGERFGIHGIQKLTRALTTAMTSDHYDPIPQLPLELALIEFIGEGATAQVQTQAPKEQPTPPQDNVQPTQEVPKTETPPVVESHVTEEPPMVDSTSDAPVDIKVETVVEEQVNSETTPVEGILSVEEMKNKWKRCTDALAKRNIALPLALQNATPHAIDGNEVTLLFTHEFHFETINKQKNLALIAEAMEDVLQRKLIVKAIYQKPADEETVDTLVEAFGGNVVD